MKIYHAQILDVARFEPADYSPLKPGDWLRIEAIADGELWLERVSSARVIRNALNRLEDLESESKTA